MFHDIFSPFESLRSAQPTQVDQVYRFQDIARYYAENAEFFLPSVFNDRTEGVPSGFCDTRRAQVTKVMGLPCVQ